MPANLLAAEVLRYHTPINSEEKRTGESLYTSDSPIGARQSSPMVWMRYNPVNQIMLTFTPGSTSFTPKAMKRYPNESNSRPIACLRGELGSIPRLPRNDQIAANTGASVTIIIGLKDWK